MSDALLSGAAGVLLARLEGVTQTAETAWAARCPAHEDKRASLSVGVGKGGAVLVKCFAGCDTADVVARVGLGLADLFPRDNGRAQRRIAATYDYTDEGGDLLYQSVRYDPKAFRARSPDGNGGWKHKEALKGVRRVLYRLPELAAAEPDARVFVVEGEKDADRLASLGLVATTNVGGAEKWRAAYNESLAGRRVAILPDNDEPGRKHADVVARSLAGVAADVRIVELPDLPDKGDVSDWLAAGGTPEGLARLVGAAPTYAVATPKADDVVPASGDITSGQFNLTDMGNAERLVARHGRNLLFCKPQKQWLLWGKGRWTADTTGAIVHAAQEAVRHIYAEAAGTDDSDRRGKLIAHALRSEAEARIRAMVELAKYNPTIRVVPDELDADPWLLGAANGVIDLRTGEFREHRRSDKITKRSPAKYTPGATSDLWARFINEATDGNAALATFLQRAVGYSLTGDTSEEKLFFIYGPAAAMKSTFIEAVKATLGDYSTTADFEAFLERRNAGGARNDIARLQGSRLVVGVEVSEGRQLAQGLVKLLTGGDTVTARFLYQEAFEFVPQFKLWLVANHTPHIADDDDAMWRRILRVPFDRVVPESKRDPEIKRSLRKDPDARAGILAWAVRGCLDWQAAGLAVPDAVRESTKGYRSDMDPLKNWLEGCCALAPDCWAESWRLRRSYENYCREDGVKDALTARRFWNRIKAHGCVAEKRDGHRGWRGIEVDHAKNGGAEEVET